MRSPLSVLNVRPEEQSKVVLLLIMGFFMGIFIATYQVTAESLFLNQIGDQLDRAFLAAGFLGILSTALFSFAQSKIRFTTLSIASILLIVLFTSVVYWLYRFGPVQYHDEILFTMFCLTGPMQAILLLCYWGLFGRLFDFRQSKRIIGWIDTGQLIAVILAFFLIPLTANLFPETSNYLIVCSLSILGSLLVVVAITFGFELTGNKPEKLEPALQAETSLRRIFKDKYTMLLSVFLVVSMVTFMLSQYTFQDTINKQYPDQRDLTDFLAYFNLTVYFISLIMQTFVNDRIISNYGIRVSLFLLPVLVGIFALASIGSGVFLGYDLSLTPSTFIYFFLFVALMRMFNWTIRESLENPVFKLLFIPLDGRIRFGIQAKIEGVVNESGRFIAGSAIFLFALIPAFKIIWIPVLIFVLIGIYFVAAKNLYQGYRNKIRAKLEEKDSLQEKLEIGLDQITKKLEDTLIEKSQSRAVFSFKLLEKINPAKLSEWVNTLVKHDHEAVREYANQRMNEIKGLSVSDRYVIRQDKGRTESESKILLTQTDLELLIKSGGEVTKTRLQRLSRSSETEDRQYAAELLLHTSHDENISFLIELLNDPEPKVRNIAIKTASKKNNNEVINALIESLNESQFSNQAMNALILIGVKALNQLDSAFYRTGQRTVALQRIIQIIGKIGGQRARNMLWNRMDFPDKVIVSQVLLSLGECGFKAGISQVTRIKFSIESDIADISWNLNAIQMLDNDELSKIIKVSLRREIQGDIDHVYMLLAMLYDTRSIQLVKENIESGTIEGTTYAVELLDVFLSEQLKQKIIPILDDLSDSDRINKLSVFYPWSKLNEKLVLKFLINRDFTQSNRWTKAAVLNLIGVRKISDFTMDLIAHLFNPDLLIKESAAWALYEIDPELYNENVTRLSSDERNHLNEVILPGDYKKLMILEKVLFYRSQSAFQSIPALALSFLSDISREVRLEANQSLVVDEKTNNRFYIIYSGSVQSFEKGEHVADYFQGQFIGERLAIPGFVNANIIVASERTIMLSVSKDRFYELLADNVKLTDKILEFV